MTDAELAAAVSKIRDDGQKRLDDLNAVMESRVDEIGKDVDWRITCLLKDSGRFKCPQCKGLGYVFRLDAGYMRRFGLRELDGCSTCGGEQEKKGMGFISQGKGA